MRQKALEKYKVIPCDNKDYDLKIIKVQKCPPEKVFMSSTGDAVCKREDLDEVKLENIPKA